MMASAIQILSHINYDLLNLASWYPVVQMLKLLASSSVFLRQGQPRRRSFKILCIKFNYIRFPKGILQQHRCHVSESRYYGILRRSAIATCYRFCSRKMHGHLAGLQESPQESPFQWIYCIYRDISHKTEVWNWLQTMQPPSTLVPYNYLDRLVELMENRNLMTSKCGHIATQRMCFQRSHIRGKMSWSHLGKYRYQTTGR